MTRWLAIFQVLLLVLASCLAQDRGGARIRRRANNRNPMMLGIFGGLLGGVVGGVLKSRSLGAKYVKEKKQLLDYITMQEDVYKQRDQQWQSEYQKLYKAYEKLETETLERDYEEFKAPDTNGDDMISRAEFAIYVKKYLSSFPELSEKDFPKFEEFDLNHDGIVSFEEWQQFLAIQKAQEAAKGSKGKNNELLDALYSSTSGADSFNSLDKQIRGGGGGGGRMRR